jgi:hypothetical protein
MPAAADGVELAKIQARLDLMELERRKDAAAAGSGQPKSWIGAITQFLVVPGAILALVLQFTQVTGGAADKEKSVAETEKIRVETLKTRADLEQQLDELAKAKGTNIVPGAG